MFGISELLEQDKLKAQKGEDSKFRQLRSIAIDENVLFYLKDRLQNLYIEVLDIAKGDIFTLMSLEKLEGWCWETTESAVVFFQDEDYIERGVLNLEKKYPNYYHSWICFSYKNKEYVLDPCLNLLCPKDAYVYLFDRKLKGKVLAKDVREELLRHYHLSKEELTFLIRGSNEVDDPMYRNNAGYKIEIEQQKIKKMSVHYYY